MRARYTNWSTELRYGYDDPLYLRVQSGKPLFAEDLQTILRAINETHIHRLELDCACFAGTFCEILKAATTSVYLRDLTIKGFLVGCPETTNALINLFDNNTRLTSFTCWSTLNDDVYKAIGRTQMPLTELGIPFSSQFMWTCVLPRHGARLRRLMLYGWESGTDDDARHVHAWMRNNRVLRILSTQASKLSEEFNDAIVSTFDCNDTLEQFLCNQNVSYRAASLPRCNRTLWQFGEKSSSMLQRNYRLVQTRKRNTFAAVVVMQGLFRYRAGVHRIIDRPVLQLIARMVAATRNNPVWEWE